MVPRRGGAAGAGEGHLRNEIPKPVGGRLQAFGPEWERLTSDVWVLQTIKTGYRIEFTGPCRLTRSPMWTRIPAKESHRLAMETGLRKMLEKRAVKIVDPLLDGPGFYSSLFLVEKRSGGWRPILNLKELNVAVKPPSFKMDTLQSVLVSLGEDIRLSQSANTLGSGQDMWAVSLDLEDAYFHVAIDPRDRKYLRFAYDGTVYEFQVLPFGLSTAPRTFTRLVRAVGAYLKTCGVNLFQYLDDWLVVGGSYDLTLQYRYLVRTCVQEIGFLINEEKSDWVPTQFPSFLGSSLDLVRALARPSGDRIDRLRRLIGRVMKEGSSTARLWRSLFGHLASMMYLVPKARQHIRPLQFFVQNQWSQDMPDTTRIRLTQSARFQLEWWLDPTNLTLGVPFSTPDPALTIVTDASSYGWGGHLGDQTASGVWPDQWKSKHINWLELQAVWLTLKHFQDQVRNQVVEVLSDNSTTVSYINRQGGTHSLTLCRLALDMWEWCDQLAIVPVAVHLQGTRNVLADALSRGRYCPTEWSLHPPTLRALFSIWGTPMVDLFATQKNRKLPMFYSLYREPESSGVNALTQNWDALYGYAYPPIALLPRVLRKIRLHPTAEVILVAPFWPSQIWFHPLTQMLVDFPRRLPDKWNLLKNSETGELYPEPSKLRLVAWKISASPTGHKGFLRQLLNSPPVVNDPQPIGFTIPVSPIIPDGALLEVWTPILPLCSK